MDAAARVLVMYSTAAGSTAGIAERIAKVLRAAGCAVRCLPASADLDLAGVDALVVGSAVHDMAWLAPSVEVLRRAAASGTPAVWCFSVGGVRPRGRVTRALAALEARRIGELFPVDLRVRDHRLFGGVVDLTSVPVTLLRRHLPQLRVRVVNVVDLMRLQESSDHPHGLTDREYDLLFPPGTPVVFAFHGYPWLIHRLTYRRHNHDDIHVRGYVEEGTTTTPFDMLMLNDLDRFHLVADVIDRVPGLGTRYAALRQHMLDERMRCRAHTRRTGEDAPDVRSWTWPDAERG